VVTTNRSPPRPQQLIRALSDLIADDAVIISLIAAPDAEGVEGISQVRASRAAA
jgi:hypothetical protein